MEDRTYSSIDETGNLCVLLFQNEGVYKSLCSIYLYFDDVTFLMNRTQQYIEKYMEEEYNVLDSENIFVGNFLLKNVHGKVLDFGCGPNLLFWGMFMQKAESIDGFDILPENINYLKRILKERKKPEIYYKVESYLKAKNAVEKSAEKIKELKVADMLAPLPFKKNYYDCVTEIGCIGCANTDKELETAVKNMYECLRPNGKAIIINWTGRTNDEVEEVSCFEGNAKISKPIFEKVFSKVGFRKVSIKLKHSKDEGFEYKTIIYGSAIK